MRYTQASIFLNTQHCNAHLLKTIALAITWSVLQTVGLAVYRRSHSRPVTTPLKNTRSTKPPSIKVQTERCKPTRTAGRIEGRSKQSSDIASMHGYTLVSRWYAHELAYTHIDLRKAIYTSTHPHIQVTSTPTTYTSPIKNNTFYTAIPCTKIPRTKVRTTVLTIKLTDQTNPHR